MVAALAGAAISLRRTVYALLRMGEYPAAQDPTLVRASQWRYPCRLCRYLDGMDRHARLRTQSAARKACAVRVSHLRTQRNRTAHSPEGHAGHPDLARGH